MFRILMVFSARYRPGTAKYSIERHSRLWRPLFALPLTQRGQMIFKKIHSVYRICCRTSALMGWRRFCDRNVLTFIQRQLPIDSIYDRSLSVVHLSVLRYLDDPPERFPFHVYFMHLWHGRKRFTFVFHSRLIFLHLTLQDCPEGEE